MNSFKVISLGINTISWIQGIPGGFVTSSEKIAILKLWSVNSK